MKIDIGDEIVEAIDASMKNDGPRPHMGCSLLGHYCDRWLWLNFRHAVIEQFSGRMLRLFRRGQNEEATFVADLRSIGVMLQHVGADQYRVDFGSHVSGSIDGIIVGGLPGKEKSQAVLECKTHSEKSFKELKDKGVKDAKFMHFVQCQVYMKGTNLKRALYMAVNKNTDELYTEWLHYDEEVANRYIKRGQQIALSEQMPPPISSDPSWYQCKFCPAHEFCHKTHLTKEVNCRTCAISTPLVDSTWFCEKYEATIPFEAQRTGCDCHVLHQDLVPWERKASNTDWQAIYIINGKDVVNGEADANVYGSSELIANADGCAMDDDFSREARELLGARVIG